ncbi:divergent PAP2 family protein [Candidatus Woesearchaeota archaeon]|nr:divergent PAP2 family protein [Candidatus Woesearchaeota archaeon]
MAEYGINALLSSKIFLSCITAYIFAGLIKIFTDFMKTKRLSILSLIRSGGMPSQHVAIGTALVLSVYLDQGFSPLFIATMVMVIYIVHESIVAKYEIGKHSTFLNILNKGFKQFRETIGHRGVEAFAGFIVGAVSTIMIGLAL